jgi:hypothetical protein
MAVPGRVVSCFGQPFELAGGSDDRSGLARAWSQAAKVAGERDEQGSSPILVSIVQPDRCGHPSVGSPIQQRRGDRHSRAPPSILSPPLEDSRRRAMPPKPLRTPPSGRSASPAVPEKASNTPPPPTHTASEILLILGTMEGTR